MYHAQDGKLFCDNPRSDKGTVEVAVCNEVNGNNPQQTADILASSLNAVINDKQKCGEKDDIIGEVYAYLLATGIDKVPRFVWDSINRAYGI